MRPRSTLQLAGIFGLLVVFPARLARADDDGNRIGLAMVAGGGVGGVVHPGPLPGPIAFTDFGAEVFGEIRPWGLFARIDYLSSGPAGRWTSFALAAGVEYRLFGDTRHTALFLRGGPTFEFLSGATSGCDVIFFIPNSCDNIGATTPTYSVDADMLGVIAGARLELPISSFYVAFSTNFVPTVALLRTQSGTLMSNPNQSFVPIDTSDSNSPIAAFELRFDLEMGFKQVRKSELEEDPAIRSRHMRHAVYNDAQ